MKKWSFNIYLAFFWSSFTGLYIMLITFLSLPTNNVRFADTILGFLLGTVVTTIINTYISHKETVKNENQSTRDSVIPLQR